MENTLTINEAEEKQRKQREKLISINGYKILYNAGSGQTAKVYIAQDKDEENQLIAIKLFRSNASMMYKIIEQETKILEDLKSQYVPQLIYSGPESILEYLDSENQIIRKNGLSFGLKYFPGNSLRNYLHKSNFPEIFARYYFIQMLQAVSFLHSKGIVHRDIKPDNFLVDQNFNIVISDFGYSQKFIHSGHKFQLSGQVGTLDYMAPEVFEDQKYEAEPTDIFSVGVILFYLMLNFKPFTRKYIFENENDNENKNKNENQNQNDQLQLIFNVRKDIYWGIISNHAAKSKILLDDQFRKLIEGILNNDPIKRLTLQQIKQYTWFKGDQPQKEELQTFLQTMLSPDQIEIPKEIFENKFSNKSPDNRTDSICGYFRFGDGVDKFDFNDLDSEILGVKYDFTFERNQPSIERQHMNSSFFVINSECDNVLQMLIVTGIKEFNADVSLDNNISKVQPIFQYDKKLYLLMLISSFKGVFQNVGGQYIR